MNKLSLEISGMSCNGCVRHVRKALESIPGVQIDDVQVGKAQVQIDPAVASADSIREAVAEAGYSVVSSS